VNKGILGGSFDPIHLGHLCIAQDAMDGLHLDKVVFMPAAQAPLKPGSVVASNAQRLAMIKASIDGEPRFEVSDLELKRGGTSYTMDTVSALHADSPEDRLFWIIGADQIARLSRWMRIGELVNEVEFICLERPGVPACPIPLIPGLRLHRCKGRPLDISSTEIRKRVRQGLALDGLMPHKAIAYIRENHLYS
jgi:nicotinate-nucleotide adenylyltransferase